MKIAMLTYGTEGDTRPLAALGHALCEAGHDVCLLGDAHSLGSQHRFEGRMMPLSGDIQALFGKGGRPTGGRDTAKALISLTNTHAAAWMKETLSAARECDAIVTSGLAGFVGLSVAEYLKIPVLGAGMIPLTPSRAFPSPFLPPAWIPAPLNRASLVLTNQLFWLAFKKTLNRARAQVLGLPPRAKLWTDHSMLYGISPTILPPPDDWPSHAHLCGQWRRPADAGYTPPDALRDFLACGTAPIYVGFGSMAGIDVPRTLEKIIAALNGRRAVVWPGRRDSRSMDLPDNILHIDAVPHDWLFPRMAAVIHHGGSGTSHSAVRSGRPSIIVPFTGDQPFWAHRLHQLGVAPAPISPARLDASTLLAAIDFVEKPAVVARAAELGRRMAREDGLIAGVALVEKIFAKTGKA